MSADRRQDDPNDVGPRPVRWNWSEFGLLLALLAAGAAFTRFAPREESEPVANCPGFTGENYAADPRNVYDDLSVNLVAAGFARTGAAPDATPGSESAMFRGEGVIVTLKYYPRAPCPRHTGERSMAWAIEGTGWRVNQLQALVRAWVAASTAANEKEKV